MTPLNFAVLKRLRLFLVALEHAKPSFRRVLADYPIFVRPLTLLGKKSATELTTIAMG